jgi:hypothetical protein
VDTDCWLFTGATTKGYGRVGVTDAVTGKVKQYQAHRAVWEARNGPIPPEKVLDHLCKNKNCVNDEHIELVGKGENTDRAVEITRIRQASATTCAFGHALTAGNTYSPKGTAKRRCRKCMALAAAKYRRNRRK